MSNHLEQENFKRIGGGLGPLVVAGDFALSAGMGATASIAITAGSTDRRGRATITSAGGSQGANPTATLTFKDGAFPAAPFAQVCRGGGSQRTVPVDVSCTATTMVVTLLGTPVDAETYIFDWNVEA